MLNRRNYPPEELVVRKQRRIDKHMEVLSVLLDAIYDHPRLSCFTLEELAESRRLTEERNRKEFEESSTKVNRGYSTVRRELENLIENHLDSIVEEFAQAMEEDEVRS